MTSNAWSSGDTDKAMRKFSQAREILVDCFDPGSFEEEFKIDEMAALSLRFNLCRAAEMDPRQSTLAHPSRRLRTIIDDEIYRTTQLKRYRELIQEEFRRAAESFYQMKAERLLRGAHEIAKQTQIRRTASVPAGSRSSEGSNQSHIFGEHRKRNLTSNEGSFLPTSP